ncbi:YcgN family cysteine cluster protein [Hyphomicrobium sp.]|uniref:YcgN family cysteine cluster protein n=1 Tax=Hyphomicrobium sp. TaxID=82 RepID=UPI002D77B8B5|nr:YcgN family cysteine cluster protein [Hyphomicrobium sp.]HET6390777.1 YcgN family cysteine cluster protein [Hyphomicrobium sp.]
MLDGNDPPFWQTKTLEEMSREEWEALCDGCGRCCLVKLEDEDTAQIYTTRLSCGMLDTRTCRCRDYPNRFSKMPDCLEIDIARARELTWLPQTCAYRLVGEGRGLMWWHPLVSGSPDTVHEAGISVRSFAMNERRVKQENYWKYIIPDEGPEEPEPTTPRQKRRRRDAVPVPSEPAE